MLRELHISNLAVIADAKLELHPRLNCFTGATGAGKSLVIGAVEILLGLRSPSEMLRAGADEGRVSGVFEIESKELLQAIDRVTDAAIARDGGEMLIVRKLYSSGRTSASINGHPITLSMLKSVAELLIDVHGQHDHQYLLKPANQIDVLDSFGNLTAVRKQYRDIYDELEQAKKQLAELSTGRDLRKQQLELYRFQLQEIDAVDVNPAEFEELRSRASVLQNLEKLKKDASATHSAIYDSDGSILERLKMAAGVLMELAELDYNLKPVAQTVRDTSLQLEDAAFDLGRYLDKLELDPGELAEVNDRLNQVNRLLSKYGDTVQMVLDFRHDIAQKIQSLEKASDDLSLFEDKIGPLTKKLTTIGKELSSKRAACAKKLVPLIEKSLGELGMDKAKFQVQMQPLVEPGATGLDSIELLAQTNPGFEAQPLRKIASGGELSRIMLALKGILAQNDRISVLVFDEIDANVGGRLGSVIGSKLRQLSSSYQVLCITHLPQIAAFAERHFTVRKESKGKETRTTVSVLERDARTEELAEMIGGEKITATTRAQAKELLESGSDAKPASPTRSRKRG